MPQLAWLRQLIGGDGASAREQLANSLRFLIPAVVGTVVLEVISLTMAVSGAPALAITFAVLGLLILIGTIGITTIVMVMIRSGVVLPLDELSITARQLSNGDLGATVHVGTLTEVRETATALATLAGQLAHERSARLADRKTADAETSTLREVLRLTRDVGSHLEQQPIIVSLGEAARRIGGYWEVIVWRYDDLAAQLIPAYPLDRITGARPLRKVNVGESDLGRSATSGQFRRLREEANRPAGVAVPLAVGGVDMRVLGVVELRGEGATPPMMQNPLEALEALASHAATALAAAQLHEQLEARSETDALTKILNRRKLDADLKAEVSRSLRYGHNLTLIMVDIDHFKSVNDTFGHQTGDEVLKVVGATIARGRETNSAYRFGGEEFAVLLRETDAVSGRGVAERLRIRIREEAAKLKLPRDITASLGVAAINNNIQAADKLIEAADHALYQAKETGRNKVVVSPLAYDGGAHPMAEQPVPGQPVPD